MNLELEISEEMGLIIADKVRCGEFESPQSLAVAAIARYLDEKAGSAHTQMLIDEAEASGPHIELTEAEWDRMMSEAVAESAREGFTIKE